MFAQLGSIVFEPLSGFDTVSSSGAAVIAQYQLLSGIPKPQQTGRELRTMSLSMQLHQRFIIIKNAVLQILADVDNATPLALVWGNGDNDGLWLISSYSFDTQEMDGYGNVFYLIVTVSLLEVPSSGLLAAKQASVVKKAVGLSTVAVPVIKAPVPRKPKQWQVWLQYLNKAKKVAGSIDSLVYSGITPLVRDVLSGNIANAATDVTLMGMQYDGLAEGFADLPDLTSYIGNVSTSLNALSTIDPIANYAAFSVAHTLFQNNMVTLFQQSFLLTARSICRMSNMII